MHGNIGLNNFIFAYDNISCIMINKGALVEDSEVEMSLRALQTNLRVKLEIKHELVSGDPSTFNYNILRKQVLDKCVTADDIMLRASEQVCVAPGVSPS